jgi:hypothetical protein
MAGAYGQIRRYVGSDSASIYVASSAGISYIHPSHHHSHRSGRPANPGEGGRAGETALPSLPS